MGNENFSEKSNKAFETAKLTSYWLCLAGIPEAIEYGKLINLDEEVDPKVIPHSEDMCFLNPIIHEIRYSSINHYIYESGCENILDIACGYSPRGLKLAKEGYHYVGADLPVVAKELSEVAKRSGIDNLDYVGIDATNYESLRSAADKLEGPICIVVEGLGMYLNSFDAATVRANIARLMSEHEGSVYITTDPGNGYLFFDVITANYPMERMREVFGMLFEMYNWASNGGITMETDKRPIEVDVQMFRESGLVANMRPILPGKPQLLAYSKLSTEVVEKLSMALDHPFTFVSTLAQDFNPEDYQESAFDIESKIDGDTLSVKLTGRLDTLSSPRLLECFEGAKDKISKVDVDCKDLTYMSASGNRDMHLIKKEPSGDDSLVVRNLNEEVAKLSQNDEIIEHL